MLTVFSWFYCQEEEIKVNRVFRNFFFIFCMFANIQSGYVMCGWRRYFHFYILREYMYTVWLTIHLSVLACLYIYNINKLVFLFLFCNGYFESNQRSRLSRWSPVIYFKQICASECIEMNKKIVHKTCYLFVYKYIHHSRLIASPE